MNRAARYEHAGSDPERDLVERYAPLFNRCARRLSVRTGGAVSSDDSGGPREPWRSSRPGAGQAGRDVKFETFAEHRVRGAMLDEMRRMDHLPRRLRTETERIERERARLGQILGHEPTARRFRELPGDPLEEIAEILTLLEPAMPVPEELPQPGAEGVDITLDRRRLAATLTTAISGLTERLRILLALYYDEGLTYREISKVMSISEPRVCQLHSDAVKRLRAAIAAP